MNLFINALNEADRTLHSLAQLIACTGITQLPTQPDDSQANLTWDPVRHRLEGRPFTWKDQPVRLSIDLPTFSMPFLNEANQPVASFAAENQTPADAITWWQTVMQGMYRRNHIGRLRTQKTGYAW